MGPWLGNDKLGGETHLMTRFNGPFRGMKQDVLEGGIRVPALLRWNDGLPSEKEFHNMVHFTDWLPTLSSACGIPYQTQFALDGLDQLFSLQGKTDQSPTQRFWQFNRYDPVMHCNAAMRDDVWKLYWPRIPEAMQKQQSDNTAYHENFHQPHVLMNVSNPPVERLLSSPCKPELYNINDDPYENDNLAEQYPEQLAKMKFDLENWFEEVETERRSIERPFEKRNKP